MARLVGPDEGSRLAFVMRPDNALAIASGLPAVICTDPDMAQPADILMLDGEPIPGGNLTIGPDSLLPLFQFPDEVAVLYGSVNGGPVMPLYARATDQVNAHASATTDVHGIADTSVLETVVGAQAKADAARDGAVQAALVTAKGDLLVASGPAAFGRLGIGADGQVLTADSAQAAGMRWAAPATSFLGRVWRSGSRYAPQAVNLGTGAPNLNEVRYVPVVVPNAVTAVEIAAEVTTAGAAGATARLIIAAAGADGRPGPIVLCTAALPATATGKISAPISTPLTPGRYYFAAVAQVSALTFRTISGVSEMIEQPSMPSYLRCCYSVYGQSGVVSGTVGAISMDAADAARVEVLIG